MMSEVHKIEVIDLQWVCGLMRGGKLSDTRNLIKLHTVA